MVSRFDTARQRLGRRLLRGLQTWRHARQRYVLLRD
jgi:hypothetical protein